MIDLTGIPGSVSQQPAQSEALAQRLLNECYELVRLSDTSAAVRALAEQRLSRLQKARASLKQDDTAFGVQSVQAKLSELRSALSAESETEPAGRSFTLSSQVQSLPESADKQYLLALLALRDNSGNQGCEAALRHLEQATRLAPGNLIYLTLTEVIISAASKSRGRGG